MNSYNPERQTAGKKKKADRDEAYTGDKNKKPEMTFPEVMKIVKTKIHKILRTKNIKKLYMCVYTHISS